MGHIAIIGGGVIGLSTAFFCARRGFQVTLVDRQPEQRDGCSFGNAGMVCPSHFIPLAAPGMVALGLKWMWNPRSPFYIRPRLDSSLFAWGWEFWKAATARRVDRAAPILRDLGLASRATFDEIAALPGTDFGWVQRGLLMLCRDPHAFDEEAAMAERARSLGIPAEILDPAQLARLDPNVRMDVIGGVHFPRDGHLTPDRFLATLESHARAAGVRFLWDTAVQNWRIEGGRITAALTTHEDLVADDFVLCGGSWSPNLGSAAGLRLLMQAGKGYSLTLPNPRQLPALCAILTEARVAVTPMGNSLRVGGTMEIAGLNEDIHPLRVRGIVEALPKYFPEFRPSDFDGIAPWRGLRPVSPDGLPYLGRTRRLSNLIVATGHAMLGLSLGPITGKLVAQIAAGETPDIDLSLLSPDRFGS